MKNFYWPLALIMAVFLVSCRTYRDPLAGLETESFLDRPVDLYTFDNSAKVINEDTTLKDLLKAAALNNASVKSAYLRWQAEILKIYPSGALPDPQLSFTHYIQEVETRVGPQENALSVMQRFPWFGKLDLKEAVQREAAKSKKAEYDAVKNSLFREVEQLYYDYWYLQQSRRITKENLQLLNSLEPIIRNKIKVGGGSKDLIKLQIEIGKLTDTVANLKIRKRPLDARLNQLLNRPANAPVKLFAVLGRTQEEWNEAELLNAIQNNPGLYRFNHLIKMHARKIELADNDRYPDFMVGLKWVQTNNSFMNTRDNGKDPVMATVGFSIPWDQRKYTDLVSAARKNYKAVSWTKREYQNSLQAKLQTALYEIEDNLRVIKLYRDTLIPKTEESLNISLQAYRNAKESFIGFVDIQRQLLNFQLILEKSRRNIAKQKAVIEELTGQKVFKGGMENE